MVPRFDNRLADCFYCRRFLRDLVPIRSVLSEYVQLGDSILPQRSPPAENGRSEHGQRQKLQLRKVPTGTENKPGSSIVLLVMSTLLGEIKYRPCISCPVS